MRRREPRAVAEHTGDARHVAPLEWRRGLVHAQRVDHELLPRGVRHGKANVGEKRVGVRPPVRLCDAFASAPNLVIRARHIDANRAVPSHTVQRIVGMPGNGETEAATVPNVHGIQDDEIAEAALRSLLLRLARAHPEQPAVIPLPVFVLAQHDGRMLELRAAEVQPPVHEIARVIPQRHPARGDEQGILIVAQFERVDGDSGEKAPGDPANVHFAADRRLDLGFDRLPHRRLPVFRLRGKDGHAHDDCPEREEHAQADEGDEIAASHATRRRRRRLRNPGRSRR